MREFHHLDSCFIEKALLSLKVKEQSAYEAFETVSKYSTFLQQVDEMGKSMDLHFAPPPSTDNVRKVVYAAFYDARLPLPKVRLHVN